MNNLFSSLSSAFSNPEDNSNLSRGYSYPNHSQTLTQILENDLCKADIKYEWLTDPKEDDKTIAVVAQTRQVSLHFFMRDSIVTYCFYDWTIKKCTIDYQYLTIEETMNNFDEFILHHYNGAKDNPYNYQKYF